MRLALAHMRANTIELARQPQYWIPSVVFPVLFFAFFGITLADQVAEQIPDSVGLGSEVMLTQFLLFGVLSIMFFQFGVGIAEERHLPWDRTLKVLPSGGAPRFVGRVGAALVFSVASIVPAIALAAIATTLRLQPGEWVVWLAAIFAGAIPFGLMGITLGFATSPKAALPIANIGFLLLSFVGDLFMPVEQLPSWVSATTDYVPTYHWKLFSLGVLDARQDGGGWVLPGLFLLGWTVLFLVAALWVYRRDEGERFT